jgi:hypothetical protein
MLPSTWNFPFVILTTKLLILRWRIRVDPILPFSRIPLIVAILLSTHFVVPPSTAASDLPHHTILRAAGPMTIDGALDEPSWAAAETVGDFQFPWWKEGDKEQTEARLLWDDANLYISFVAHDKHISAVHTQRDAPVSQDDCVEAFIMPDTTHVPHYYNIEVNVLGTVLDRFQLSDPTGAYTADMTAAVQIDGTLNDEADEDTGFVTELAIAFSSFVDTAPNLPPRPGDTWRLNLYRIGGKVNPQYSQWSNTGTPQPKYHVPERFGIVHFSADSVEVQATGSQAAPQKVAD